MIIIFNDFLLFYRQNDNNKIIFKKIKGRLIFLLVAYICTTMFLSTSKTDQNTGATWFQWVTCFSENGHFKLTDTLKELPSSGAKDGLRAESQRWCKEDGICRKTDWLTHCWFGAFSWLCRLPEVWHKAFPSEQQNQSSIQNSCAK